ncbi:MULTISPECIES: glycoside hydrolase family 1 protein [Anoxybacillaceae]|uniref:Glycoside hydrolase family 1 protein n=1 Tax=Anoxybacteroides rupiense TaxID=311460 RepID=A0ABD5IXK2_9BACL|nr:MULTISPECIES: glycoside hydrolase family 1 protein [Anoxybacillus]MED5053085.1 glycoside hydrolase family 1 protein [Anoxybacillus rupiensis]
MKAIQETKQQLPYRFPQGFWWGSAVSATQIEGASREGGKGPNIWDYWYEQEPHRFFDGVGPETTSDFYHRYKEDIQLLKETGHNSFRFSISWSRLIPDGKGAVNAEAVQFYQQVIDGLLDHDIEPFVTLYHFDMPLAMQQIGGWESREVVDAYARYAKICFELFGDRVKKWFTHNEPIVPVEGGYLYDFHYPNVVDFRRAVQVAYHTVLAHAKAVREFRNSKAKDGKIGIILNLTPSYPRSQHPADVQAAHIADLFFNRSFLDPVVKGEYPRDLVELLKKYGYLPIIEGGDLPLIKENTIDILGINYYQPRRVKAKDYLPNPEAPFMPERFFDYYVMPGRKMNPYRGWEIYAKGIYDILINIKENYENIECFISENGMGVEGEERFRDETGMICDDYRIDFIKEHLKWVHRAIQEGVHVKGYHLWTFMDNWSWTNAYKNRYGLVSVDLNNDQKRSIKKSGYWFKALSQNNGF